jgi:hypothetical protein
MRNPGFTATVTAALIAAAIGCAGVASAAAIDPQNAETVIHDLQSGGRRVILDKVGTAPLSQCHVTSVRLGQPITETVPAGGGDTEQKTVYTPVYVSVAP